jgi:hypothetical protein
VPVCGPFIPIAKKKLGVVNAEDFSSGVACGLSGRGNAVLERRSSCSRSAQGDEHAPLRSPSPPERNGIEWIGNDSEDFIYLFIYLFPVTNVWQPSFCTLDSLDLELFRHGKAILHRMYCVADHARSFVLCGLDPRVSILVLCTGVFWLCVPCALLLCRYYAGRRQLDRQTLVQRPRNEQREGCSSGPLGG